VEYKKEKENVSTDSLSKKVDTDETSILIITKVESDWLVQLKAMIGANEFFQDLNSKWETGSLDFDKYEKRGGLFLLQQHDPDKPHLSHSSTHS